ncbi:Transglutaminase-like enzyme, putative cysteine protease [Mucilaginibacter lappiensis]|uniref:Transglutaminase-like putative cysteine protease n=1 Tax=Mucilaginibacter lappiensis TaxID=354630 RepID=A0ABR6PIR9_9SPHI|nr:transglutaminase family protein [Mucilaginibacter lappiensis]MBB6109668.1 transglutaminase-like putative cysteine protease [Mucilaginibacter lappiensis]SIR11178.1 Transglutaminase-like enzyme, putative cysteine protease [Mucilaginibacter lappiensis]
MKFNVFTQMQYEARSEGTLVLNIHALRTPNQLVLSEELTIDPYLKAEELIAIQGESRLMRVELTEPCSLKITYRALVDNCYELHDFSHLPEALVSQLPATVLHYLNPSRYCQSDKLYRLAHNLFGYITNPFEQVVTLTDWIHQNVQYLSGYSNAQTSAFDTVTEQIGVCRDFAHLGIALCRALTIPARYFTGYAYHLKPADFHACFEAYLGGNWVLFDATKLVPLNGLIKIATGRDAADTAIANIFGDINFTTMEVSCELAEAENFEPFYYEAGGFKGLVYL